MEVNKYGANLPGFFQEFKSIKKPDSFLGQLVCHLAIIQNAGEDQLCIAHRNYPE